MQGLSPGPDRSRRETRGRRENRSRRSGCSPTAPGCPIPAPPSPPCRADSAASCCAMTTIPRGRRSAGTCGESAATGGCCWRSPGTGGWPRHSAPACICVPAAVLRRREAARRSPVRPIAAPTSSPPAVPGRRWSSSHRYSPRPAIQGPARWAPLAGTPSPSAPGSPSARWAGWTARGSGGCPGGAARPGRSAPWDPSKPSRNRLFRNSI